MFIAAGTAMAGMIGGLTSIAAGAVLVAGADWQTTWQGPIVLGIAFAVWLLVLKVEGWAIVAGMLTLLAFFLLIGAPWTWLAVWVGNFLIFLLRHKADFRRRPDLRAGILGRFLATV